VIIKDPMALLVKSRSVASGHIYFIGPYPSWPPNNPHQLIWFDHSLSSPPIAGVCWALLYYGCCHIRMACTHAH